MSAPKVCADFQNLDNRNRLRLTCAGTRADLQRQQVELREGLVLLFCMDDADEQGQPDELLVEGTVHFNPEEQIWVATVDWSTVRHASESKSPGLPASDAKNGAHSREVKTSKP